jgi:PAS domain S-box-containing protein
VEILSSSIQLFGKAVTFRSGAPTMTKNPPYFGYLDDDDDISQGFIDRGATPTQSIDLQGLMAELDTLGEELRTDDLESTPFGKLMEAVPIPALVLDRDRHITFVNQAAEKISAKYDLLKGKECALLFPDAKTGKFVDSLIKTVYFDRQTQVIESVVQIGDSRIWGRVHLQPLRWGEDTLVLALIENLTLEKTQLSLQKKLRKELENRVEERTKDLASINEMLQREIAERKRAESELKTHRQNLEQLVVERTRELNLTIARTKQEVKERKKAESSLRSSEHRLQLAFHANPGAVSIMSLNDGRYVDVNASFCKFSGYSAPEIIGRTDEELNFWAHAGLRESMIQTLKESGRINGFESVFRSKTGKMHVGSLSAELIDLDGQPHILCVVMDITDQKRAERDQNLFTAAIDRIDESVLISDARGFIKFANSAFEKASGYSREELRGQNISLVRSPENDQNKLSQLNNLTKQGKQWQGRLINRTKNGSAYEVEATVLPVTGKSPRLMNLVIVERPAVSWTPLEKQNGQLSGTHGIDSAAVRLALELNDVFAAQMGYAYLAGEKLAPETPARKDLERLIAMGDRTAGLINDLLALSGTVDEEYGFDGLTGGTERILFIASEEDLAIVGKRILESVGYNVTALRNVSEAIATFQSDPYAFDLVISELTLPTMSGLELAQALESIREDVRILLCAGRCEALNLAEIKRSCVQDVFFKPFSPSVLCSAVRHALD